MIIQEKQTILVATGRFMGGDIQKYSNGDDAVILFLYIELLISLAMIVTVTPYIP